MSFLDIRARTAFRPLGTNLSFNFGHSSKRLCPVKPTIRNYATPPIKYRFPSSAGDGYQRFKSSANQSFYMSKRLWIFTATGVVIYGGYYVTHLEKVPISGRVRFMSITPKQEEAMAVMAYNDVMRQFHNRILPPNHPYTLFVKRVAKRLVQVSGMEDLKWEFYVIDSPERNAFVLPGGKVFVFTGILPIVKNEDGMAAVLGHEIAHQLARHSAEKVSVTKIIFVMMLTLQLFGIDTSFLFNQFTLNYLMMSPFSRKCETEADVIGLQLMAQACFEPRESLEVWRRMSAIDKNEPPQFLSTHPSHKNRVERLAQEMPNALQKREDGDCSSEMRVFADMFRDARVRW
ncbi:uncharacterized protein RHIMIDRAFT_269471 [Rhizopus microsporus ATCC 52813]|uniref:Peptidase M48 domain-containing protein n=1 Tax=Rhizopus microsporus ATCC 52813 TaxID=1340429 RepID=A0A2G4SHP0_RHIZD|nr:uncharacterized protein RHIMIDRAFT_269471 [Rhizopus microsporus ATCC 52813]PHZ08269.1 hypothetical protein RHIMIDRAFT_269471 [Rhizopus microsporus ATCC 52813]